MHHAHVAVVKNSRNVMEVDMNQDLKEETKADWIIPISPEAYRVINLMSEGIGNKNYIDIAVCTLAVEQLDRISKKGIIPPVNVIRAVEALTKKVHSQGK